MQDYGAPSMPSASTWAVPAHHKQPTAPESLAPGDLPGTHMAGKARMATRGRLQQCPGRSLGST